MSQGRQLLEVDGQAYSVGWRFEGYFSGVDVGVTEQALDAYGLRARSQQPPDFDAAQGNPFQDLVQESGSPSVRLVLVSPEEGEQQAGLSLGPEDGSTVADSRQNVTDTGIEVVAGLSRPDAAALGKLIVAASEGVEEGVFDWMHAQGQIFPEGDIVLGGLQSAAMLLGATAAGLAIVRQSWRRVAAPGVLAVGAGWLANRRKANQQGQIQIVASTVAVGYGDFARDDLVHHLGVAS